MSRYAASTDVPTDRSRVEIEKTLRRYGADELMVYTSRTQAVVQFSYQARVAKFSLPLPDPSAREFTVTPTGRDRSASQAEAAYEQSVRQKWRALALFIKATLEAVESGILDFDTAFLPHLLMPNGETVAQAVLPRMQAAIDSGETPTRLLPELEARTRA